MRGRRDEDVKMRRCEDEKMSSFVKTMEDLRENLKDTR